MKAGQNSQDQVTTQGLMSKCKLGDVPQPETVYEKEELSLKDRLCLDPLKKTPTNHLGSNLEQPVREKH